MGGDKGQCERFVKYTLYFSNFITFITAIVIIVLGIWFICEKAFIREVLGNDLYYWSAYIFLVAGIILAVVCLAGFYGTIKEAHCILLVYFFITLLVLAILVAATTFCFLFHNEAALSIHNALESSIKEYDTNADVKQAWDRIQSNLYCCGVDSYADWKKLPASCCTDILPDKECSPDNPTFRKSGCLNATTEYIQLHAAYLGATGVVSIILTFVAMVFSCLLACI